MRGLTGLVIIVVMSYIMSCHEVSINKRVYNCELKHKGSVIDCQSFTDQSILLYWDIYENTTILQISDEMSFSKLHKSLLAVQARAHLTFISSFIISFDDSGNKLTIFDVANLCLEVFQVAKSMITAIVLCQRLRNFLTWFWTTFNRYISIRWSDASQLSQADLLYVYLDSSLCVRGGEKRPPMSVQTRRKVLLVAIGFTMTWWTARLQMKFHDFWNERCSVNYR